LNRFTIEEAEERVLQNPNSFENQGLLGELLYQSKRYEEASEPLKKAAGLLQTQIDSLPQGTRLGFIGAFPADIIRRIHHDMYLMRGDCLIKLGRYAEASGVLENGVGKIDEDPDGWNMLGVAQANSGNLGKALRSFREAVRQNPARRDLWENLQKCYRSLRRPEAEDISLVLGGKRDLEDDMVLLIDFFIGGGEYDRAKSVIDRLVEWKSKDKRVLLPMSRLYIIEGEYKKAQEALEELLKTDRNNIEALWHLSRVYAIQGKRNDSLKQLGIVLKLDSNHSNAGTLKRILEHHGVETQLTFGVFTHKEIQPSEQDDKTIHEYEVHPELKLPIGSTVEDALHFLVKGEFYRFSEKKALKYVHLMLLQMPGSLGITCDGIPFPVSHRPTTFHAYASSEPAEYEASMVEPYRNRSSISAVIVPNAMYSLLKTTANPFQRVAVLTMWTILRGEIDKVLENWDQKWGHVEGI